jgi:hypothetical protein
MKKKETIIISIAVILILGLAFALNSYVSNKNKEVSSRCTNYDAKNDAVDCYGLISIYANEGPGYTLNLNDPSLDFIASINNLNEFKVIGNYLYVINKQPHTCFDNLTHKYCFDFRVNGKYTGYEYNSISEIPTYLIVDTQNGNENLYVNPQEASSSAQVIFKEIEGK